MEEIPNLVSVIITTCKRKPEIIARAIRSVVVQTYAPLEIIVVDDSPSSFALRGEVKKAVESIPPAFNPVYLAHEKNSGACKARNTGLAHARGEFTAYLDDDDEWLPAKIEKQVRKMKECGPDTALVYCGRISVYPNGKTEEFPAVYEPANVKTKIHLKNFIGGMSYPLLRTRALKAVGGFDEKMQSAQDVDVWIRIVEKYDIACVKEPLLYYHIHAQEQISSNPTKKLNGLKRLYEKNKTFYQNHKEANYSHLLRLSFLYAWNGMFHKAISLWFQCVKMFPLKIVTNAAYALRICKRAAMYWKNRKKICQLQKENPII